MSTTDTIKRIGILTGGGDCPGLNAVIRAVTKTAIYQYGLDVWGIEDGFLGLIRNRMHRLESDDVSNILTQGGTILGTSNRANPAHFAVSSNPDGSPVFQDVTNRVLEHIDERHLDHWNHDPWTYDYGGNGTRMSDGAIFLLPYYMGLYYGFIT